MVFISVEQTFAGEGRKLLMSAIAGKRPLKCVVVCDEDIDVFDDSQVLWAIATRARPAEDIVILPKFPTANLDPSVPEGELGSALGIDATRPFGEPFPEVPFHPGLDRVPDLIEMMRRVAG